MTCIYCGDCIKERCNSSVCQEDDGEECNYKKAREKLEKVGVPLAAV